MCRILSVAQPNVIDYIGWVISRSTFLLFTCLLALAPRITAQPTAPSVPDWENPHVFGIGKEPPRAHYMPYPGEAAAVSKQASSLVESLNAENLTITAATKHPAFNLLDRQRLQTWQRKLYAEIESITDLLLPAK